MKKEIKEEIEKKDEMSNSFCSEKSSRDKSLSDSPIKEKENDDIDDIKNTDFFFLSDLNCALGIFSNDN